MENEWLIDDRQRSIGGIVGSALLLNGGRMPGDKMVRDLSLSELWNLGFGQASTLFLVSLGTSLNLTGNIVLANLPQLILSLLYFFYNAIYTCQLVTNEWSQFSRYRKRLRVTIPRQGQVSTYYLGLPYSYGIPLLLTSVLLHWLFSRSFFFVDITFLDYREYPAHHTIHNIVTQCGYSPIAVIISVIVAGITVVVSVLNGFRRYETGIPLAATCSAAISAACHPDLDEEPNAAFEPVQWGVVSQEQGIGHCAFSSRDVNLPTTQDVYLGKR